MELCYVGLGLISLYDGKQNQHYNITKAIEYFEKALYFGEYEAASYLAGIYLQNTVY